MLRSRALARPTGAGARADDARLLGPALWCAGLGTFAVLYAPQGLLTQVAQETGASPAGAGLLVAAGTAGLAASVLPWAWFSDRVGRTGAMRVAALASVVLAFVVPFLPTLTLLLVGRFVQGAALGGVAALAVAVAHEHAPLRAGTLAGAYVAATSVGGLAGRLLAVPVADRLGWRAALLVVGVVVAVLLGGLVALLPATRRPAPAQRAARGTVRAYLRDPRLVALFVVGGLLVGGMAAVYTFLPFRLEAAPYGLAPAVVSLVFLAYLAGTGGSQAASRLARRWGTAPVLGAACGLLALGALVTLATPLPVVLAGVVLLTVGLFVGHAVAASRVAALATTGRAQATALYTVTYYVGSSVLGATAGPLWAVGGWPAVAGLVVATGLAALVLVARTARAGDGRGPRAVPARAGHAPVARRET